ncbi:MAG: Gmad2 immunoglobulin-like domain-containing protein [Parcubacteria group bacterium]|jgi:hypothetical protein
MKKVLIFGGIIILLAGAVLLGIRFFSGEDNWICQNGEWIKHGNPNAEKPTTGCGENLSNQTKEQPVEEPNIVVFDPKENAKISSPFDVTGKARVFENMVSIRLKDKSGKVLFQGTTDAKSPDAGKFGLFQEEIAYSTVQAEGILEVFESSAKDGSEINKVVIPVKFGNEQSE